MIVHRIYLIRGLKNWGECHDRHLCEVTQSFQSFSSDKPQSCLWKLPPQWTLFDLQTGCKRFHLTHEVDKQAKCHIAVRIFLNRHNTRYFYNTLPSRLIEIASAYLATYLQVAFVLCPSSRFRVFGNVNEATECCKNNPVYIEWLMTFARIYKQNTLQSYQLSVSK